MAALQPPPIKDANLAFSIQLWYNQIRQYVGGGAGTITWVTVSKAGANITDIPLRDHNNLTSIFGGAAADYYHMKQTEYTSHTGTKSVTTTTTLTTTDNGLILATSAGGAYTITLPAASTLKKFFIKKTDASANVITISRAGADTIEGATSVSLAAQYKSYTLCSDGSSTWYIQSST